MRRIMREIAIGVFAIATGAALMAPPASAIVYGELDAGRHPNVGIFAVQATDGSWTYGCGGTLIAPRVVVTAGHCVAYLGASEAYVSFGADPEGDSPPDWDGELFHGTFHLPEGGIWHDHADPMDLAVLVLDEDPGITPARLPSLNLLGEMKDHLAGQGFTVVGFGAVRDSFSGGANAWHYDFVRRLATETYLSLQANWLTASMNPNTGNGGTCWTDSGGPHFLGTSDTIVALTVTGDMVCKALDQAYRLDTSAARGFLEEFVDLP